MHASGDVLVVDDEANIVDLIAEVLHEEGYHVRRAHDGKSALATLSDSIPSMILLDMSMPDMIGTTLLQQIRTRGMTDLPVIIMTAGSHSPESLVAQGATGYLAKPFDLDDLLNCVSRYIKTTSCEKH